MARARERLALISDIHGNAVALAAVLEELEASKVDRVVCLGDTATLGPSPQRTLELLHARCESFVQGNHDEYLLDDALITRHTTSQDVLDAVSWCRQELSAVHLSLVREFKPALVTEVGGQRVRLFHGSPSSNNDDLLAETPGPALAAHLEETNEGVLAGGHTHLQLLRQHHGRLLINPGSVGLPFERFVAGAPPRLLHVAEFAVLEIGGGNVSVSLRRVPVDVRRMHDEALAWDCPFRDQLVAQYARR